MNSQLVSLLQHHDYLAYYRYAFTHLKMLDDFITKTNQKDQPFLYKIILGGGTGMSIYFL